MKESERVARTIVLYIVLLRYTERERLEQNRERDTVRWIRENKGRQTASQTDRQTEDNTKPP